MTSPTPPGTASPPDPATGVAPDRSGPAAPYWAALDAGKLCFQRCQSCGAAQLPPRENCTSCLSDDLTWDQASGAAKLISWVIYHRAFHPAFADQVPYNVAVIELAEGPRLISNVAAQEQDLRIDMALKLEFATRFGQMIPQFAPL